MEYTRSGYEKQAKHFKELTRDLSGKSVLITGGNSGIGLDAAIKLGAMGANIHIACRSRERGESALGQIQKTARGTCQLHLLDLSDSKAVHEFGREFSRDNSLYCLVNNAGCMVNEREVTAAGFEKNFATNTLGMYILTKSLIGSIEDEGRVVTVTSGGMLTQKLMLDDLQYEKGTFDGTAAYAQQKRQQVCITEEWARAYPKIHFSTTHPGWVDTSVVRTSMPDFHAKMKDKLRTSEQGADCIVWLVAVEKSELKSSGGFYQDRAEVAKHLPLGCSKETEAERKQLLALLDDMAAQTDA